MNEQNADLSQDQGQKTEKVAPAASGQNQEDVELELSVDAEGSNESEDSPDDGEFTGDTEAELKTVRKALDKRNRYINNQRTRIRSLEAEVQKIKDGYSKNAKPAPQMEQFDSVLDYVRADSNYTLEQKFAEQQQQQQLTALEQQQAAIRLQQDAAIEQGLSELVNTNADVKAVLSQALPVIQAMPQQVGSLLYEIDDAPAAVYALAKEGRLQDLYYMNPYVAAAELVQAQHRGQQYLNATTPQPQQQKPPKPLDGLKGRGSQSGRPLHEKSGDELLKWLNT